MTKTQWALLAIAIVISFFVVMFWQPTPTQPQTTAPTQTTVTVLPTAPTTTPAPIPASPITNEKPETRFTMAHQLLPLAQQGDATAQYQLADILRFCDGISKISRYFADDANYYLATANDTDSAFFTALKQAVTDCTEFNQQNLQDFQIEEPDIAAADY